jgi:hypothetical protein
MPNFSGVWDLRQQGVAVKGDNWPLPPIFTSDSILLAQAYTGGGGLGYSTAITRVSLSTGGRQLDYGDLTVGRNSMGAASSSTRGLYVGGHASGGIYSDVIDYITIATDGNATDFGNMSAGANENSAVSSSTRAVYRLGYATSAASRTVEYVTIASTGNATDFGDTSYSNISGQTGTCSTTRGVFTGGYQTSIGSPAQNVMDYFTIASTGNLTDFGNLNVAVSYPNEGICSSGTYGYTTGGSSTNHIQYITIASTGNASDFGDLTYDTVDGAQSGNTTRGIALGGYDTTTSGYQEVSFFTMGTSGSGSDWGDLTTNAGNCAALSATHGGLA